MPKLVRAESHDSIVFKDTLVPWSDIWISFTTKPARKTKRYGPTFYGRADIEQELDFERKFLRQYPEHEEETRERIVELATVLEMFNVQDIVVRNIDSGHGTPDIYINKDYFNRKDADRMIDALMKHLGYSGARVKWPRPPKFVVQCV